jgi:hypothetical protein
MIAIQTPGMHSNRFKKSNQDANNGGRVCKYVICYFYNTTNCVDSEVEFIVLMGHWGTKQNSKFFIYHN